MAILGIVDQSGKLVVKYKYDAYGNNKGIEDTSGCSLGSRNPFRYKGYYYDDDTEMYYCKSRFYVPKWRRWLNSDSINYLEPQNITCLNLFAYCNNNPVMYVDPTGDFAISISALLIGAGVGALIGGAIAGVKAYVDGERGWDLICDIVGGIILGAASGLVTTLGGAAGLSAVGGVISGSLSLSTATALGISIGSMSIGSMAKYSFECIASPTNSWNGLGFILSGVQGALQGVSSFGISYIGGKSGLFNKIAKNLPTNDSFFLNCGGMTNLRAFVWAFKVLFGERISKAILVGGIAGVAKWLIDKLMPDIY